MATIGERLSDQQRAAIEQAVNNIPQELDFGQLASPTDLPQVESPQDGGQPAQVIELKPVSRGGVVSVEVSHDVRIAPGSIRPVGHPKAVKRSGKPVEHNIDKQTLSAGKAVAGKHEIAGAKPAVPGNTAVSQQAKNQAGHKSKRPESLNQTAGTSQADVSQQPAAGAVHHRSRRGAVSPQGSSEIYNLNGDIVKGASVPKPAESLADDPREQFMEFVDALPKDARAGVRKLVKLLEAADAGQVNRISALFDALGSEGAAIDKRQRASLLDHLERIGAIEIPRQGNWQHDNGQPKRLVSLIGKPKAQAPKQPVSGPKPKSQTSKHAGAKPAAPKASPAVKDAGDFNHYDQRVYSNGAVHVYAKETEDGKLTHLSHDNILRAYGYDIDSDDYRAAFRANQDLKYQAPAWDPNSPIQIIQNPNTLPIQTSVPNMLPRPTDLGPKSLRERLKLGMRKTFEAVAGIYTQPDGGKRYDTRSAITGRLARMAWRADMARMNAGEAIMNMSQAEQKRRRLVAGVVGAVAVLGGAYLVYRGVEAHHHANDLLNNGNNGGSGAGKNAVGALPGGGGSTGAESLSSAHLSLGHHGDTIWTEVVGFATSHGVKLDEEHKRQVVDAVLKANGQTWESARDLPVGYRFDISPDILERFFKINKH